ncbi:MAG: (2Fe-2S)-binding protein [Myxococcales bacterium]|nr:(2Fe-2S)-binding protein [Myxococcales bacterium]
MRSEKPKGRDGGLVQIERTIELEIDGRAVRVPEGSTILDACRKLGVDTPTLCYADNLTPVNACRVCVVELEGSRTLVASCSRKAEAKMVVRTESERVKSARKMVLELLGSSVDMSATANFENWCSRYSASPERLGTPPNAPAVIDNDLFVRDYAKCMLCYKCVEACGDDAQHTFAIAMTGRGGEAKIATEFDVSLPDSACVFCGNCVGVCPTAALQFKREHDLREAGEWDESKQSVTKTVCPYCGVGCVLELHVQDDEIVRVTSPSDSSVTDGHLCVKGRFGWGYVR